MLLELSQSRKQYTELLKAYQDLELRSHAGFEMVEERECNKSLVAKVEELVYERSATLENMNTNIGKLGLLMF